MYLSLYFTVYWHHMQMRVTVSLVRVSLYRTVNWRHVHPRSLQYRAKDDMRNGTYAGAFTGAIIGLRGESVELFVLANVTAICTPS